MPVIRHRMVHVSGVEVFVREAGEPARPALVPLHGFPSSSRQYVRLIDRLAGHWHVIAPAYPGFGLSGCFDGGRAKSRRYGRLCGGGGKVRMRRRSGRSAVRPWSWVLSNAQSYAAGALQRGGANGSDVGMRVQFVGGGSAPAGVAGNGSEPLTGSR